MNDRRVPVREGSGATKLVNPYGSVGSAAWGFVAIAAFLGTQAVLFLAVVFGTGGNVLLGRRVANPEERTVTYEWLGVEALLTNGIYISVSTILGGLAGAAILVAATRRRFVVRDYLSLRWPGLRTLLLWMLAGAGFWAAFDALAFLLDRPLPQSMVNVYISAGSRALLYMAVASLFFAVVVFVPIFEETLFRGFLFPGWSRSPLRISGTIALTAALWAALHLQYDAFEIGGLFLYGILLGTARQRTDSLIVPLALHGLVKAVAFAQWAFGSAMGP